MHLKYIFCKNVLAREVQRHTGDTKSETVAIFLLKYLQLRDYHPKRFRSWRLEAGRNHLECELAAAPLL